jgi:D-alanine-D-alanine ligase-like ATP-grasp enzyme
MSNRQFHQYFGPSPRFDRACVELRFPLGDETYRLAPLEPLLLGLGFKLREVLPDGPLPLDAAVCRLASALLARHRPWWNRHGSSDGTGWAAIEYPFPAIGTRVLDAAQRLITAGQAVPEPVVASLRSLSNWLAQISKLRMWALGAALDLARPAITLVMSSEVYQVGHGAKGVHCYRLGSQADSITGQKLEESKYITVQVLRRLGLPTTNPVLVQGTGEVAAAVAQVGLPCVVKPLNLLMGIGVAPGLTSEAEVIAAVENALKQSKPPVQIENHVDGYGHRLVVANSELMWAYRRTPSAIVGDGISTIGQLIDRENHRRSKIRTFSEGYLFPIETGDGLHRLLADRHGLTLDAVLEAGRTLEVVAQTNISQGGSQEDVTGEVHPDNRDLAIKVAQLFRLRSTGIDFITPDISKSWKECPSAIIEINRLPGAEGYGDALCVHRMLFPNRRSGRIPTVAVIGSEAYRTQVAQTMLAAFSTAGLRAGKVTYAREKTGPRTVIAPSSGNPSVDTLLLDPQVDAAVILCEPDAVEHAGLPVRRADLALVEEAARFAWLERDADQLMTGPSSAALAKAIGQLAKTYADPSEGGPLPVIEPVAPALAGEFRVKVWRARAVPHAWFWNQVGIAAETSAGLTTHDDLLAATRALAAAALQKGSGPKLAPAFVYGELPGAWARGTFEATLALPARQRDAARNALLAALDQVNRIAAMKVV